MNTHHQPENSMRLTSEDLFLLDLLADGELDDERREKLIRKLDAVPNGWRTCAAVFLENQCWSQSVKAAASVAEPVQNRPAVDKAVETVPNEEADDAEPYIIPLRRGRRKIEFMPKGISRRSFFTAMASGFLLAVVITAGLGSLYWAVGTAPHQELNPITAMPAQTLETAAQEPFAANRHTVSPPAQPIRRVTLKSSSNDLDGISVPCVESDQFDPALLADSTAGQMADRLRKDGHRVETVSEQLMFQLDDGRMLIVPVDTINVRYKEKDKVVPVQFQ